MKRYFVLLTAMILLTLSVGDGQAEQKPRSIMRAKLEYSQKILEALALEDYPTIERSANELKAISLDSHWQVLTTEDYLWYSKDFRRSTTLLAESAAEKNLDASLLGYFQLTQSCVNCHKHVRSQMRK